MTECPAVTVTLRPAPAVTVAACLDRRGPPPPPAPLEDEPAP